MVVDMVFRFQNTMVGSSLGTGWQDFSIRYSTTVTHHDLEKNCYSSANSNDNPIEAIELKYIPFWKSLILEYWVLPLLNFFFPKFIFCKTRK
jgi:hypothetical protein